MVVHPPFGNLKYTYRDSMGTSYSMHYDAGGVGIYQPKISWRRSSRVYSTIYGCLRKIAWLVMAL